MSLTIEAAAELSDSSASDLTIVSPSERARRLNAASANWAQRLGEDPATATLTFRAGGTAAGSVASVITAGRHSFVVDEPAGLGGDDAAASPVEYALGALIACQVVVYRLYAHTLGIPFDSLTIDAEGDLDVRGLFGLDEGVRPGFSDVRLSVHLSGPESAERYQELQDAVAAHCPVQDLFQNPTPFSATLVAQ